MRHEVLVKVLKAIIELLEKYRQEIASLSEKDKLLLMKHGISLGIQDFRFTTKAIVKKTGLHEKTVYFYLKALETSGILINYRRKWFFNPKLIELFSG